MTTRIALKLLFLLVALLAPATAHAGTDDYPSPWRPPTAQDSMVDSWGYYNRECTSFVAWRLHSRNGFEMPRAIGDASNWGYWAAGHGYAVNGTPAVGAVAWSSAGHVAWVEAVGNGTVTIEEYNHGYNGLYSERTVTTGTFQYIHFHDISLSDGMYIAIAGHGEVYKIVGGAPLYVSSWDAVGGPQPVTVVSQAQFDGLRPYPADGTYVGTSGDGRVYKIVGGAPLYVSSWDAVGGPKAAIGIDRWDVENPSNPLAHLRQYPADGTFVGTSGDGRVYEIVGGAPLYVSTWDAVGGPKAAIGIDKWDVDNTADPHAHLRQYPADGTFVGTSGDGRVYVIAGGAPIYVSTWDAVGGPKAAFGIDKWDVDNSADPHAHLRQYPADGTFLRVASGQVYRVAGHAPFAVSSWSVFGGPQPTVGIDAWAIANRADVHAHLATVPADGTVVQGLPSRSLWTFTNGVRSSTGSGTGAVQVDDAGLSAFPLPPQPSAAGPTSSSPPASIPSTDPIATTQQSTGTPAQTPGTAHNTCAKAAARVSRLRRAVKATSHAFHAHGGRRLAKRLRTLRREFKAAQRQWRSC